MKRLIIYIAILLPRFMEAQNPVYKQYNTENGLIQNQIQALNQDKNGYFWIGTKGGISIFDGLNFMNFGTSEGLNGTEVRDIVEDKHRHVWVLTSNGLTEFVDYKPIKHEIARQIPDLLFLNYFYYNPEKDCIYLTATATDAYSFYQYKNKQLKLLYSFEKKSTKTDLNYLPHINSLFANGQLFHLDTKDTTVLPVKLFNFYQLNDSNFFSYYFDRIYLLSSSFKIYDTLYNSPYAIKKTKTYYDTLIELSGHAQHLNSKYLFFHQPENKKFSILGSENGFYHYSHSPFLYFPPQNKQFSEIWAINELKHIMYFFSFQNGITQLNTKTKETSYAPSSKLYYFGRSKFDENTILQGSYEGLSFINQSGEQLSNELMPSLSYIFFDSLAKEYYICHSEGLSIMNKQQQFTHFYNNEGYDLGYPLCITKDKNDSLWIVGSRRINTYKNGVFNKLNHRIENSGMLTIARDHKDNLWLGGRNGLYLYDYEHFKKINHPKINTTITAIYQLNKQKLLIGTITGMAMLDLDLFYREDSLFVHYFDNSNGFKNLEVQQNSLFMSSDNSLWIPLTTGVMKVDTAFLKFNRNKPKARVHKIINMQEENNSLSEYIVADDTIFVFEPNQTNFRVEFTAFEYNNPQKIQFSHRLIGFENNWSKLSDSRYVEYTNLPPGKYTFELIAYNENKVPSDIHSVKFTLKKAWFQYNAVYVLALILILIGIMLMYRAYYKRKIKQQEIQKNKAIETEQLKVQLLMNQLDNHFIFNAIGTAANLSFSKPTQQYDYLASLANLLRYLLKNKNEFAVSMSEELKHIYDLVAIQSLRFPGRIKFELKQYFSDKELNELKVPILFIFHFVENAIKYSVEVTSRVGEIKFRIKKDEINPNYAFIEIEDNGVGIKNEPKSTTGTRIGLISNDKLIKILNTYNPKYKIDYTIENKTGGESGTIVKIKIPFNYNFNLYETTDS